MICPYHLREQVYVVTDQFSNAEFCFFDSISVFFTQQFRSDHKCMLNNNRLVFIKFLMDIIQAIFRRITYPKLIIVLFKSTSISIYLKCFLSLANGLVALYPTINLFVFFKNLAGIGRSSFHVMFMGRDPWCDT